MKKENRQMAQERRTQERKRKEQKEKTKKFLMIGLPVLVVILFIAVIIVDAVQNSNTTGETASAAKSSVSNEITADVENSVTDDSVAGSVIEAEETTYQTDPSLTVADGDTVNIDYVGSIDGVEFAGGNTQGMGTDLVIGSGSYIDDFEEQLIGAHPGDNVTVTVTFPEDYGKENLNGKEAVFEVTVNGIYD